MMHKTNNDYSNNLEAEKEELDDGIYFILFLLI